MTEGVISIVVMGVQGSGKSTIGTLLAERLGVPFVDGDRLHPQSNIDRMAAGIPLDDTDREPWLTAVGEALLTQRSTGGVVIACSALKRAYRDVLRSYEPALFVVEPSGPIELVAQRVGARSHEYMPPTLLQSQYDALEPLAHDESGIRVSIRLSPREIVDQIMVHLTMGTGTQA